MSWRCPKGHTPNEFVVRIDESLDPDGIGILVYPNGVVSNRWADGTVGITKAIEAYAEDEESAHCGECMEEAIWSRHSPYPWEIEHPFSEIGTYITEPRSTAMVAKVFAQDVKEDEENNARLLMAAPELYHAAKKAIEVMYECVRGNYSVPNIGAEGSPFDALEMAVELAERGRTVEQEQTPN